MILKNAMLTAGVRVGLLAAGLSTTIITARWLGPSGRGDYFYVVALSTVAGQVVHLGMHASNAYFVAKRPELFGRLALNSYWISVVLGTAAGAAAIFLALLVGHGDHGLPALAWALVLTPASLAVLFVSNLYVGAGRIAEYNGIQLASVVLPFAMICGAAPFWRSAPAFLAAASIAAALNQVLLATYALRRARAGWRFDAALFRAGLPYAVRAYVVNALSTLALKAPSLMFTTAALRSELGYFSIASQVFDAISIVPASIATVLFPVLMKMDVERWRETRYYMAILMGMTAAAAAIVAVAGAPLVAILFGQSFAAAAAPLRWVLPAAVFVSGTSILSQYLATHGMPRSTALAWLAAALICVLFGPWLIRTHGAVGAAQVQSGACAVAWVILLALGARAARRSRE